MFDFLVVGGGVIGLSVAWELARRKQRVCVVDSQQMGSATSWGGAGIFPPPRSGATHDPLEQLRTESHQLHLEWSERLLADVGVDNQLLACGGIYFARRVGEAVALRVEMQQAQQDGVRCEELTSSQLLAKEPALQSVVGQIEVAYELPDEMQLRSPPHMQAMIQACEQLGVEFRPECAVQDIQIAGDDVVSAQTTQGPIAAKHYCICSGAWAASLLGPLGITVPVEPWRGQLLIWQTPQPIFSRVINEGLRYFVPRKDGVVLVGATVEDVGFDLQTTPEAVDELTEYSLQIAPELTGQQPKRIWAGLRSKTPDGLPFMGRVPGFSNLSVCVGHFRSGLHLSPVSAVFMAGLLLDDTAPYDATPFRVQR